MKKQDGHECEIEGCFSLANANERYGPEDDHLCKVCWPHKVFADFESDATGYGYCLEHYRYRYGEIGTKENTKKGSINDSNNKSKKSMIRQITPEIAKLFTQEERMLYRAGLLDGNKRWSKEAAELAVLLFLEDRKTEMAKLAQEIVQEERESMMMGWGMFEGIENKKIPGKE